MPEKFFLSFQLQIHLPFNSCIHMSTVLSRRVYSLFWCRISPAVSSKPYPLSCSRADRMAKKKALVLTNFVCSPSWLPKCHCYLFKRRRDQAHIQYLKITIHEEKENIQINQPNKTPAKVLLTVLLKNRGSVGVILCCLQTSLPHELWGLASKESKKWCAVMVMCMEGISPYFTSSLETGRYLWEYLLYSVLGWFRLCRQAVQKQPVLTEGKHNIICNVTCDLGHVFQIGMLMAGADGCKKLPLKGNGGAGFLCLGGAAISQAPFFCTLQYLKREYSEVNRRFAIDFNGAKTL